MWGKVTKSVKKYLDDFALWLLPFSFSLNEPDRIYVHTNIFNKLHSFLDGPIARIAWFSRMTEVNPFFANRASGG